MTLRPATAWIVAVTLLLLNALPPGALSPDLFLARGTSAPAATLHERAAEPVVVPRPVPRVIGTKANIYRNAEASQPSDGEPAALLPKAPFAPEFEVQRAAPVLAAFDIRPIRPRVFDPRAPPSPVS